MLERRVDAERREMSEHRASDPYLDAWRAVAPSTISADRSDRTTSFEARLTVFSRRGELALKVGDFL